MRALHRKVFLLYDATVPLSKLRTRSVSKMTGEVLATIRGSCGVITLNKPSKLNALNLSMVEAIKHHMVQMEKDKNVACILVKSNSPKAFCAGGDVQAVTESAKNKGTYHRQFFFNEYVVNYMTASCSKPYIALINGITMGGGVGLSVHGRFRVATETSLFAMPETAIGLFPDVGGGHFLSRLPENLGMFLALTGHRLKGYDLLHAGIATHFVTSSQIEQIVEDMSQISTGDLSGVANSVKSVLEAHQDDSLRSLSSEPQFSLNSKLDSIATVFGQPSVEDVLVQLKNDKSDWAQKTLSIMKKFSPRSMKLTHKQLQKGKALDIAQDLQMEYRLAVGCCELDGDFIEGVRALLVDKDNQPKWSATSVEQVEDNFVDKFFEPLDVDLDVVAEKAKLFKT